MTQQLCAMKEDKNQSLIFIKNLNIKTHRAQFLNNDEIVVLNNKKGIIIDITQENSSFEPTPKFQYKSFAINTKTQQIAFFNKNKIAIYDVKTKKSCILSSDIAKKEIIDCQFGLQDNAFIINIFDFETRKSHLQECNCIDGNYLKNIIFNQIIKLAVNPMSNVAYVLYVLDKDSVELYNPSYQLFDSKKQPISIQLNSRPTQFQISSNNLLATLNYASVSLINKKDHQFYTVDCSLARTYFATMCFNPTGSILLTILEIPEQTTINYVLKYWNTKTLQLVNKECLENYPPIYDIAFAPDGAKIIITSQDNCTLYSTPFNVQYKSKNFPYILFALKQCLDRDNKIIPNEIARLIAHMCLASSKR
jgi:hypothetical protein